MTPFGLWLTGLSGSGKSAIARAFAAALHARGVDCAVLESDVLRTQLTPFPRYDDAERDFFYAALVDLGQALVARDRPVVFDATGNRRRYRDAARRAIARFLEAYVDTPIEVCAARDPKGLYRGGTARLPGRGAPYEPPAAPEIVLHGALDTPQRSAERLLAALDERRWLA